MSSSRHACAVLYSCLAIRMASKDCIPHWVHVTACAYAGLALHGGVKQIEACCLPTDVSSVLLLLLRSLQVICQMYT